MIPSVDKPRMLFVDDRSKRIHAALRQHGEFYDVTIAPNVPEAMRLLSKPGWNVISLDYDLNGFDLCDPSNKNCGMEIVRYMSKLPRNVKDELCQTIIVHSSNLLGASIMVERLRAEGFKHVCAQVFRYKGEE